MGMTNQSTHTKVNAGELSEAVLAVEAIVRQTGRTRKDVVDLALSSKGQTRVDGVTLVYDGKARNALVEVQQSLDSPTELYKELKTAAGQVLNHVWEAVAPLTKVEVLGANGGKCDNRLMGGAGAVALSLKYQHDAPTRRQSPKWETLVEAYGLLGIDIRFFKATYAAAYAVFHIGGKRNSNKKGDYSEELRSACDLLQATELTMWREIAARLDTIFDPARAARGIVDMYCGDEDSIYYAEMHSGSVTLVSKAEVSKVESALRAGAPRMVVSTTDGGKTNKFDLFVGEMRVLHAYSTVSTNAASHSDHTTRIPKPQTYFIPQLTNLL